MSFSRAKVQRFNEKPSCAPPPGAYHPQSSGKGRAVGEKRDRPVRPRGQAGQPADGGSSEPDRCTPSALPLLRTPVLRRKACAREQPHARTAGPGDEGRVSRPTPRVQAPEHDRDALRDGRHGLEQDYEARLAELRQKHGDAEARLEERTSSCVRLQEQLALAETRLQQSQEECEDLKLGLSLLTEQCEQHVIENNNLKSRIHILEERESSFVGSGELEQLKQVNGALTVELQGLCKCAGDIRELQRGRKLLELEVCGKQEMILSLQSELEEARLEKEELASECRAQTRQHTSLLDEFQARLCREHEALLAFSKSTEEKLLTLQLELQTLAASQKDEVNCLKREYDEAISNFLEETNSVIKSKEGTVEDLNQTVQSNRKMLDDLQCLLHNLERAYECEVNYMKESHKEELLKVFFESSSILQSKESTIKFLEEKLVILEERLEGQDCRLSDLNSIQETEIVGNCDFKENEQNKLAIETGLADTDLSLADVMRMHQEVVKCLCKVDMEDVNKMLQENACVIESKEYVIRALRTAVETAEAELESLRGQAGSQMEQMQAAHREEVDRNKAVMEAKEAELEALRSSFRDTADRLSCRERECDDLKIANVENKLTIIELQDELDTVTLELGRLEVCRRNTHASLEVVTARLLAAERDLERSTRQREALAAENQRLLQQVRRLAEQLETEKLNIDDMERKVRADVECVKSDLLAKLEEFRSVAGDREHALRVEVLKKQEMVETLSVKLEDLRTKLELPASAEGEVLGGLPGPARLQPALEELRRQLCTDCATRPAVCAQLHLLQEQCLRCSEGEGRARPCRDRPADCFDQPRPWHIEQDKERLGQRVRRQRHGAEEPCHKPAVPRGKENHPGAPRASLRQVNRLL